MMTSSAGSPDPGLRPYWPKLLARRFGLLPALLLALMLAAAACASAAPSEPADTNTGDASPTGKLTVVTTLNIVADWVAVVGGDRVQVTPLLPPDTDPHTYKPGAQDISKVADADLVITVGEGLEDQWINDLVANVAKDTDSIVTLHQYIDLLEYEESEHGHEEDDHGRAHSHGQDDHGHDHSDDGDADHKHDHDDDDDDHGHDHGPLDPHFWFDPLRVKDAVHGIEHSLAAADPAGDSQYEANADAYAAELDALHGWIEEQVEAVPQDRRLLVSSHDSLRYFAHRYGFKVVGAVKPPSGQEEPTAQELAELADHIEEEGVPAIFSENVFSPRLSQRIAEETGIKVVSALRTSSLSEPSGNAGTYLEFMRYNVGVIVGALK